MLTPDQITARLASIGSEDNLCVRAQRVALLVTEQFRTLGWDLVVVGGSAIEFYTSGDYMSGDVDLAFLGNIRPEPRRIIEALAPLGSSTGSLRTFKIGGIFVDILGELDTWANTPLREMRGEEGGILRLIQPEDLLPQRILIATYPNEQPRAMAAAKKLLAVCRAGKVVVDWAEMKRVAALPAYEVERELEQMMNEPDGPAS